jgi:glyoxylase-like metal-dependent hydrolase (beta-lactamase superfamily II)
LIPFFQRLVMTPRISVALLCLTIVGLVAWLRSAAQTQSGPRWTEVAPGVLRSPGAPAGYALVSGGKALLIDAPHPADGLPGNAAVEQVLLTHYHRASVAAVGTFLKSKVPVRAPKGADEWLHPDKVRKYWQESLPLRNSRTAYLVVPQGFDNIDCSLVGGQKIAWHDWTLEIADTPGHALTSPSLPRRTTDSASSSAAARSPRPARSGPPTPPTGTTGPTSA